MAGDWIKIETVTPDKPEVVAIAGELGIDQDAVTGKLVRLWVWANANSVDGHALTVTKAFLDRLTYCPGFADALQSVGWLDGEDGSFEIRNFDRHNGNTAKQRALGKERKQRSRKCHDESVTKSGQKRDQRREEKRREEDKRELTLSCPPADDAGDLLTEFWQAYPQKGRERSTKAKVATEWKRVKAKDRPTKEQLLAAVKGWKASEHWAEGYVKGAHLFIKEAFWESVPQPVRSVGAGFVTSRRKPQEPNPDGLEAAEALAILNE